MSVNFFREACKTESNNEVFGICDDPPPATEPAYIDEDNSALWIAIVNNSTSHTVEFYAIDHCVPIHKEDGNMESRCDGMLLYSNKLIFIELKERKKGQWFKKGREQLTATINRFKSENDLMVYDKVEAYVCNSLKPLANMGQMENIQRFKNETGLILKSDQKINLS
ncbi:MAG: hypothetical protein HQK65_20785 [Desulfamplus sp.]|nr:hypothetical protein [Desulfamplus sp.]